ncbi:hypothetical protein BpHYR1_004602 [Brachionus plicatilis]|uniref:Uncharacterized protein n=1 Tax=Brachionus plicatilis TaxID=10195 RepID=A0A3M7PAZ5_BRAPC|nr:hypothetical protein BpHYR1_004602 [Brachionus plicatilis]
MPYSTQFQNAQHKNAFKLASKFSKASKCNIKLNCYKVELNSKKYSCKFFTKLECWAHLLALKELFKKRTNLSINLKEVEQKMRENGFLEAKCGIPRFSFKFFFKFITEPSYFEKIIPVNSRSTRNH